MMRRILVGLDGSPIAERLLPYAEALARASGAKVVLSRAVSRNGGRRSAAERRREATQYLEPLVARLSDEGILAESLATIGNPARIIVDQARRDVDLVVLTAGPTGGRSGRRRPQGIDVEAVVASSPAPVLVVPPTPTLRPLAAGTDLRILVPLDGSPFAEAALPPALALARTFDAVVLLLDVVDLEAPVSAHAAVAWEFLPQSLPLQDERLAAGYLDGVVSALCSLGIRAARAVEADHPAPEIIEAAERVGAALIVMAVRQEPDGGTVLGDVARGVLIGAQQAVLFVPSRAEITPPAPKRSSSGERPARTP